MVVFCWAAAGEAAGGNEMTSEKFLHGIDGVSTWVGKAVSWLIVVLTRQDTWHAALVLFPLVYFVYRSYKMYLDRL